MNIFKKFYTKLRYKHAMKKTSSLLAESMTICEKNEERIHELEELIQEDKKAFCSNQ